MAIEQELGRDAASSVSTITEIAEYLREGGVFIARETLSISFVDGSFQMEFVLHGSQQATGTTMENVARQLPGISSVTGFTLSHSSRG